MVQADLLLCALRESGQKVPVLMYHHINHHAGDTVTVTPEVFAAQMQFLSAEGYQTLSADELLSFIQGKQFGSGKSVAITFDDGWLDNYLYAVPVLQRNRFKATFFIITNRADEASKRERQLNLDIPDHETAKKLIQSDAAESVVLDWELIRELDSGTFFRFYSHTASHSRIASLSSQQMHAELIQSKERLEAETGRNCEYLCWPYGSFTPEAVGIAEKVGYTAIFTTIDGVCEAGSNPFLLKRIEVMNSVEWLKKRLSEENQ